MTTVKARYSGYGLSVRAVRRLAGLTQADLASAIGVARTTIVAIEANQREVTEDEMFAVARHCGVTLAELESDVPNEAHLNVGRLSRRERRLIQAWRDRDYESITLMMAGAIKRQRRTGVPDDAGDTEPAIAGG